MSEFGIYMDKERIKNMVKIKIKTDDQMLKDNKYLFHFGFTGYGYCKEEDLKKDYITFMCEDTYDGNRGWSLERKYIEVVREEK